MALTDGRVGEYDKCVHVVEPFDAESSLVVFPFLKDALDVAGLESADGTSSIHFKHLQEGQHTPWRSSRGARFG